RCWSVARGGGCVSKSPRTWIGPFSSCRAAAAGSQSAPRIWGQSRAGPPRPLDSSRDRRPAIIGLDKSRNSSILPPHKKQDSETEGELVHETLAQEAAVARQAPGGLGGSEGNLRPFRA